MDQTCKALTIEEIAAINKAFCLTYGGSYTPLQLNFMNRGSLENILDAIHDSYFGVEPYPEIIDKCAAVGWCIMASHVFNDGCKRTGLEVCRLMLEMNGYSMTLASNAYEIALGVAKSEVDRDAFRDWVKSNARRHRLVRRRPISRRLNKSED